MKRAILLEEIRGLDSLEENIILSTEEKVGRENAKA